MVCSPGLAVISKSDLISQYKAGQFWEPITQTPSPTPTVVPTTAPTTTQTPTPFITTGGVRVSSTPTRAMVFIDGSCKGRTPIAIYDLSAGTHQIRVSWWGYEDYSTEVLIPEPSPPHCHVSPGWPVGWVGCEWPLPITIDVTLKKIEYQKPTIPTIVPKNQYLSPFL